MRVIDERVMVVEVWFACVRVVCVGLVDMVRYGTGTRCNAVKVTKNERVS